MNLKRLLLALLAFILITPATSVYPSPRFSEETVMLEMPDGVRLATTIYKPDTEPPWPVLLVRTPYNRTSMARIAAAVNTYGVALVSQDTRGRFQSEGQFVGFFEFKTDGRATLDWILAQVWSNGRVGTWGMSALGIAQYLLAPDAPSGLVCQWIEFATPDLYRDWVYQGGGYRQELTDLLYTGFNAPHLRSAWEGHPLNTSFWDAVQLDDYTQVNTLGVHIAGYYDIFAAGTVRGFQRYQHDGGEGARGKQHLLIGPWTHNTFNLTESGQLVFPNGVFEAYHQWFGLWLQGCLIEGNLSILDSIPPVTYFTMGQNSWYTAETWPPNDVIETPLYLASNNRLKFDSFLTGSDTFVYDPRNPTPTRGGANLTGTYGPYDQRSIESRADVLVYSTEILTVPLEVTGNLRAKIWIMADVPDTDIVVRLTDVYPDGRSMLIADGIARARFRYSPDQTSEAFLVSGLPTLLVVELGPTSILFHEGHQIRISVTASNSPRFMPNPNTGEMFLRGNSQPAELTILHDERYPSAIILPIR